MPKVTRFATTAIASCHEVVAQEMPPRVLTTQDTDIDDDKWLLQGA
jgi:hypothetical protein